MNAFRLTRSAAALAASVFVLCAGVAHAQLQVGLKVSKVQHIVQEPINVTLTIVNRSGADFIIGGPKGGKWIRFEFSDINDRLLAANDTDDTKPEIFPAGATVTRDIIVAPRILLEQGHYGLKALVYHPASGKFFESERARIQVMEGQMYGKPLTFGVPPGFPDAGRTRKYVLLQHQDFNRSYLYARVVDERSGAMIRTFQLGTLTLFREPQYTLDRFNNLHVMFLTAPTIYRYCVIRPDSSIETQSMYKEVETNRPKLYLTASNDVILQGGVVYDPAAERAAAAAAKKGRSIGERPPGL